jgi:FkbM family methyltransferase
MRSPERTMKYQVKAALQWALGFHRYLVAHSLFVALTMRFRRNEGDVRLFIDRLRTDANVLDVGANVGTMTLLFARKCPRGKVFAFEPIPDNRAAAAAVLRLCGVRNARLFGLGVSDRAESMPMVMPRMGKRVRMEGTCHVVRDPSFHDLDGTRYDVPMIALDEFADIGRTRIDAIKIDVEDHEQFVLRGALRLIERDRPLIYCELWGAQNKEECFRMLGALGYSAFVAVRGALQPYDARVHRSINFFFVSPEGGKNVSNVLRPSTQPQSLISQSLI